MTAECRIVKGHHSADMYIPIVYVFEFKIIVYYKLCKGSHDRV